MPGETCDEVSHGVHLKGSILMVVLINTVFFVKVSRYRTII